MTRMARGLPPGGWRFSPMAVPLAYIAYEPEPQLPLLADMLPADPQTEIQREVQANLLDEIHSVLHQITDPQLHEISQTILNEMLRFFDWLARIENNLQKLDTLLESLSLLEVLEFEARSLIDYVDAKASAIGGRHERLRSEEHTSEL